MMASVGELVLSLVSRGSGTCNAKVIAFEAQVCSSLEGKNNVIKNLTCQESPEQIKPKYAPSL